MNIAQTSGQSPETIRQERALYERSPAGVFAAVAGNCAGGLGVAFIAGVVCHWIGVSNVMTARVVISTWLIAWGAIMALWQSQDELAIVKAQHKVATLTAHLDNAEDKIAELLADNATLKHENSMMAWRIQEGERNRNFTPATSPETPAYRDAKELIRTWAQVGKHPSRRQMGWTDTRHSAAMWVLKDRKIVTVDTGNVVSWLAPDSSTALLMLAVGKAQLESWPGGSTSASQDA